MAQDLEAKTLNAKLLKEGFEALQAIPNEKLPEKLSPILIDLARGKYSEVRIVPGDLAFGDYVWQLEKQSHVVYVKDNPLRTQRTRLTMVNVVHRETGEQNILPLSYIK